MAYIAHPIGGDIDRNIADLLHVMEEVHDEDTYPMAPYRPSLEYLDDDDPVEREKGMEKNFEYFRRGWTDECWLTGPELSSGMQEEVRYAAEYDIPIRYEPQLEEYVEEFLDTEQLDVENCGALAETYTLLDE